MKTLRIDAAGESLTNIITLILKVTYALLKGEEVKTVQDDHGWIMVDITDDPEDHALTPADLEQSHVHRNDIFTHTVSIRPYGKGWRVQFSTVTNDPGHSRYLAHGDMIFEDPEQAYKTYLRWRRSEEG